MAGDTRSKPTVSRRGKTAMTEPAARLRDFIRLAFDDAPGPDRSGRLFARRGTLEMQF